MFRQLPDHHGEIVTLTFDGKPFTAMRGDSLAAALLAAGVTYLRTTPVSGAERGPYCMMGVCFECLVTVNGRSNRQACLVTVEEDMRVETQRGKASYPERTGR
ncbi:(2Fe-2S)-binding protein [Agrobacterium fabrum]|uniref:(2Fe-2S)-binding protein n=1 Tax=Agrobacterium fabrum TaxID=1176649 RepID=UPI003BA02A5E